MMTVEKIVIALREKPLTRSELSKHIIELTGRALLYQLSHLEDYGFVKKDDGRRNARYHLVTEQGLMQTCNCCERVRPTWMVKQSICTYCGNSHWIGQGRAPQNARKRGYKKPQPFAKEDACSIAYHCLLRGQTIGTTQLSSNKDTQ